MTRLMYINPNETVIPGNTAYNCACGQSCALRILDPRGFYVVVLYCEACINNTDWHSHINDSSILGNYGRQIANTADGAYLFELDGNFYVEQPDGQVITLDDDRSLENPYFPARVEVYRVMASPFLTSGFEYTLDAAIGLAKQFTTEDILNDTYTGHHFVAYTDHLTGKTFTHHIND
jgi:hypothetical protein